MEVHAHTHTARKKWTHYLWEFLMLFLAVFCGFLAENQREHYIEHQREKQYIASLINDIKSDLYQLDDLDKEWEKSLEAADSLLTCLTGKEIYTNSCPAFQLVYRSTGFTDFVSNDGTIQQLKNSGGLRLLRKSKIADSIMSYQKTVDRINIKQAAMNEAQQYRSRITDLFDVINISLANDEDIPLLNGDKKALNSAYNYIRIWKDKFIGLRSLCYETRECGKRLLKAIHEQYGIK